MSTLEEDIHQLQLSASGVAQKTMALRAEVAGLLGPIIALRARITIEVEDKDEKKEKLAMLDQAQAAILKMQNQLQ